MAKAKGLTGFYGNIPGYKERLSAKEVWHRVIVGKIKRNVSNYPKVSGANFYSNGSATMSGKDNISYYYTIDGYPYQIPINFKSDITM